MQQLAKLWAAMAAILACGSAQAVQFEFQPLTVKGAVATEATGINAEGLVVGSLQRRQGDSLVWRPFSYRDGQYTLYESLEPVSLRFEGVNADGHVVANVIHRNDRQSASLIADEGKRRLAVPGSEETLANAVNDADQVVGSHVHDPDAQGLSTTSGFIWDAQQGYLSVDAPEADRLTVLWSINNQGEAVGMYADAHFIYHGLLRAADGSLSTLDYPGSDYTQLTGINDQGVITGFYQSPVDYSLRGFRYARGVFDDLVAPDASNGTYPRAIAADGRIAGWYVDGEGTVRSFIATPVVPNAN
jgi:hypothetical protein